VDTLAQKFLVIGSGPDLLPFFPDDGGRAGVLAKGQHPLGGNFRISQQRNRDSPVVGGGFRVGQDCRHLFQVRGAEQEGNIPHGTVGQKGKAFRVHFEDFLAVKIYRGNIILGQQAVFRVILGLGKRFLILELWHFRLLYLQCFRFNERRGKLSEHTLI